MLSLQDMKCSIHTLMRLICMYYCASCNLVSYRQVFITRNRFSFKRARYFISQKKDRWIRNRDRDILWNDFRQIDSNTYVFSQPQISDTFRFGDALSEYKFYNCFLNISFLCNSINIVDPTHSCFLNTQYVFGRHDEFTVSQYVGLEKERLLCDMMQTVNKPKRKYNKL